MTEESVEKRQWLFGFSLKSYCEMDCEEPNQLIKIVFHQTQICIRCDAVFFLAFSICINIRFFFCVRLDPLFNILCVQQKNACVPGCNESLCIHLCLVRYSGKPPPTPPSRWMWFPRKFIGWQSLSLPLLWYTSDSNIIVKGLTRLILWINSYPLDQKNIIKTYWVVQCIEIYPRVLSPLWTTRTSA